MSLHNNKLHFSFKIFFITFITRRLKIAVQFQEILIPGDSGVYSSPNSPDIRFVSGHQRSQGATRAQPTPTSLNSSDETEDRKTSHGSFSETIAGLLNLPSEVCNNSLILFNNLRYNNVKL